MHIFFLGASQGVGFAAASRLLGKGETATFLLRRPAVFEQDPQMQPYIKKGKATLVKGDALKADDVRKAWQAALTAGQGRVDAVVFTIGNHDKTIPNCCARSLLNLLSTIPDALRPADAQPRLVAITTMGVTSEARSELPLLFKPIYGKMLSKPIADKLGMERILAHCAGWRWTSRDDVRTDILPSGWQETTPGLLGAGELRHVVLLRPAAYTDGKCRGDEDKPGKPPYRTKRNGELGNAYWISRKDAAHFIAEDVLQDWNKWEGSGVCIGY